MTRLITQLRPRSQLVSKKSGSSAHPESPPYRHPRVLRTSPHLKTDPAKSPVHRPYRPQVWCQDVAMGHPLFTLEQSIEQLDRSAVENVGVGYGNVRQPAAI